MSGWGGRKIARWRIAVIAVFGHTCVICHEPIDLELAYPHPRSFSLEHLVPRSRGGVDSLTNLRPAHLACNESRGNRDLTPARRERRIGAFSYAENS